MRFKQARRIIEGLGWKVDRVKGSHYIFVKDGVEMILAQHTKDLPIFMRRKIDKLVKEHEQIQKVVVDEFPKIEDSYQESGISTCEVR